MPFTVITTIWTGGTGLPGYTRFKFDGELDGAGAGAAAARVRTFWEAIRLRIPNTIQLTIQPDAQIYDNNGDLSGLASFPPPAQSTGGGTGGYAAPLGAVVNWLTNSSLSGRRVKGKTYLVPLLNSNFVGDGTLDGATVTNLQSAAAAMANAVPAMIVASQVKVLGVPTGVAQSPITGAQVPDRAAVLTSRRD